MSQPERSPAEHRAAVSAWALQAPANDSEIFGRKPAGSPTSKHAALSEDLEGLRHWRAFRGPDTGWLAPHADNDNGPETPGMNAQIVVRPSPRTLAAVDTDDVERDDKGRVIRMGRVLISNGEQYEPAVGYDDYGRLITCMTRIPQGAVTGYLSSKWDPKNPENVKRWSTPTEEAERASGAKASREDNDRRNDHFKWYAGADKPGAAALPREPKHLWQLFVGGQNRKRPKGNDHADDEPHLLNERERHVQMTMTPLEIDILDTALEARGFADIGKLAGSNNEKAAQRTGKRILMAAAKKFEEVRQTMP